MGFFDFLPGLGRRQSQSTAAIDDPFSQFKATLISEVQSARDLVQRTGLNAGEYARLEALDTNLSLLQIISDVRPNPEFKEILTKVLSSDFDTATQEIRAIRDREEPEVLRLLILLLENHQESSVRKAAASALSCRSDEEAYVARHNSFYQDTDPIVRESTIHALSAVNESTDRDYLIAEFSNLTERLRDNALDLLIEAKEQAEVVQFFDDRSKFSEAEEIKLNDEL